MELIELKDKIVAEFVGSQADLLEVLALVEQDQAVFPFNLIR